VDIVLTVQSRNQGYERFAELTFDDFRRMATDDSLSAYEKIGFPDEYREGSEEAIFEDIVAKLPALTGTQRTILDIGPGCSDLPRMLDELCQRQDHTLILIDSGEMLDHHPDRPGLRKAPGSFPECADDLADSRGTVDAILAYSVLHYVFPEGSVFGFLDRAIELLAPGGSMLIGDIPNTSKRKRFFSSAADVSSTGSSPAAMRTPSWTSAASNAIGSTTRSSWACSAVPARPVAMPTWSHSGTISPSPTGVRTS